MPVKIILDESLPDFSARMRRSTFVAIPTIVQSKITVGDHIMVGLVQLDKAYMLTLVADDVCEDKTLHVSPGVKQLFYSGQSELAV